MKWSEWSETGFITLQHKNCLSICRLLVSEQQQRENREMTSRSTGRRETRETSDDEHRRSRAVAVAFKSETFNSFSRNRKIFVVFFYHCMSIWSMGRGGRQSRWLMDLSNYECKKGSEAKEREKKSITIQSVLGNCPVFYSISYDDVHVSCLSYLVQCVLMCKTP